jgi:hypothetical protein
MNQLVLLLKQSRWLPDSKESLQLDRDSSSDIDARAEATKQYDLASQDFSSQQLKKWSVEIKNQENAIAETRRNALNPEVQEELTTTVKATSSFDSACRLSLPTPPTQSAPPPPEPLSSNAVIQQIGDQFQLNAKQWVAFRIIAEHFVQYFVEKRLDTPPPLTMLMTGPGGTGKTHVVKAVRAVMEYYGHGHIIRFLAPTGSAAALIDGMTIHKGLGIKIKATNKGKGNRIPGDSLQDYSVIVSNQNKTQLREEWRNVAYLLIDETSLLGLQLLAQLDHALRVAKERPDLWFGGVTLILSGDFFQYAPVGGTALYTPISRYAGQTDDEIQKRLGRLAWKTIDTVVTLAEQQRMKLDPEYADAVSRLRVRECTYEDVELFNSRVIRSADNSIGIDMGSAPNIEAAAIVTTNNVREALNARKAEATCGASDMVSSHALDRCAHRELTREEQHKLLRLNFNNVRASNSLPGVIPLYVGMPVILRVRNISTDLGITNGSQGIVRHLVTEACQSGLTHVRCAIVEFPTSKVHLSKLPPSFFPIMPVNWSFTTLLEDDQGVQQKLRITRHQMPIQPAFAVTGHSAQGKTLPSVLVNLRDGGFGAYVAASRARTREGLCVTHTVTLDQLNKPLPVDLIREVRRFEAIEHNTYIRCGFRTGEYVQVPDAEAESTNQPTPVCSSMTAPPTRPSTKRKRTKKDIEGGDANDGDRRQRKSARRSTGGKSTADELKEDDVPLNFNTPDLFEGGCTWDATNWSCAYDCVFMIMYGMHATESAAWRERWSRSSALTGTLSRAYTSLMLSRDRRSCWFDFHRDAFRDALTKLHPTFPRYGQIGTSASAVLDLLNADVGCRPYIAMVCFNGCNIWESTTIHSSDLLPTLFTPSIWTTVAGSVGLTEHPTQISVQTWVITFLQSIVHGNRRLWSGTTCPQCHTCSLSPIVCLHSLPPVLIFETVPGIIPRLVPSEVFALPTTETDAIYDLRGVISLEGFHFTARLLDRYPSERQWTYDGRKNAGTPSPHQQTLTVNRDADCIYVYGLRL